jgi:hypothetical protein
MPGQTSQSPTSTASSIPSSVRYETIFPRLSESSATPNLLPQEMAAREFVPSLGKNQFVAWGEEVGAESGVGFPSEKAKSAQADLRACPGWLRPE